MDLNDKNIYVRKRKLKTQKVIQNKSNKSVRFLCLNKIIIYSLRNEQILNIFLLNKICILNRQVYKKDHF
jgi:hypothetical protein